MILTLINVKRADTHVLVIRVARGGTVCTCTPRADKKFCEPNLQGKVVNASQTERAPLQAEQGSIFLGNWGYLAVGLVNLVALACVVRATAKKNVVNFLGEERCTPKKILAIPMTLGHMWPISLTYNSKTIVRDDITHHIVHFLTRFRRFLIRC